MSENWTEFVGRVTYGVPREQVADAVGLHVTSIYRWLKSPKQKSPEMAIKFARGMSVSPVAALVAAGYLRAEEVDGAVQVVRSAATLPDDELLAEVARRMASRTSDLAQSCS